MPAVEEGVISSPVLGNSKTSTPYVTLVPWDPDSKEHVDRLFNQRIACGWKSNQVEKWRGLQKEGKIAISWVVSGPKATHYIDLRFIDHIESNNLLRYFPKMKKRRKSC